MPIFPTFITHSGIGCKKAYEEDEPSETSFFPERQAWRWVNTTPPDTLKFFASRVKYFNFPSVGCLQELELLENPCFFHLVAWNLLMENRKLKLTEIGVGRGETQLDKGKSFGN